MSVKTTSTTLSRHTSDPASNRVRLRIHSRASHRATGIEPLTLGLPFGRAQCRPEHTVSLHDDAGRPVPVQTRALATWDDGSIKWMLVDFPHDHDRGSAGVDLTWHSTPPAEPAAAIATIDREAVLIDTHAARFLLRPGVAFPFERVTVAGRDVIDIADTRLTIEDADGRVHVPHIDSVRVEENGPLRARIRVEGRIGAGRTPLLALVARLEFFAGLPTVRCALTLRNPRRAVHKGGFWDLGDPGSVLLRDVSLAVTTPGRAARGVTCSVEAGQPFESANAPIEIYQDSSGGMNWTSRVHVNREGRVPNRFRGYICRSAAGEAPGLRATPHVAMTSGDEWVALAVSDFWQNFPKALEVRDASMHLRLWPRQYDDLHEVQGGEQKTHTFYLSVGRGTVDLNAIDWCRQPSTVQADASWYCATRVVPFLAAAGNDPDSRYERLVAEAVDGPRSLMGKRETIDEYGWRHFGELYADHEGAMHPEPMVSHYNNQYDALAGFGYQFMRTGDHRWRRLMDDLAAHVADIDIYHTDDDRALYNHGLFWHTAHYVPADRCTHRSYPSSAPAASGGPGAEQDYAGGLALHYWLTGNPLSRDAALELAGWVADMDDGRKARFSWLARSDTGWASMTAALTYQGPGRGAANSINTLLDAHKLTGERRWIDKAEQILRRCIHPCDDIPSRDLLNVELRWSYTVFLQALGRFLEYKRELCELDGSYLYARDSLLAYARWMHEYERPYLDHPETLEYPNETWAAQDLRKAEVFRWAAMHAEGIERTRFAERASRFYDYAIGELMKRETRAYTRPQVILLTAGALQAGLSTAPASQLAAAASYGPPPPPFEPHKYKVLRRVKRIAMVGAGVGMLGLMGLAFFLLRGAP